MSTRSTGTGNLIFQQGEEATPALDMLDERGPMATIAYLAEVAAEGDPSGQEIRREPAAGQADRTFAADGYILTWDRGGNYIGLEREDLRGPMSPEAQAEPDADR
jgi:hypothetical protein